MFPISPYGFGHDQLDPDTTGTNETDWAAHAASVASPWVSRPALEWRAIKRAHTRYWHHAGASPTQLKHYLWVLCRDAGHVFGASAEFFFHQDRLPREARRKLRRAYLKR